MVALLKEKSKVQTAQKERKSYPALDITKRLKVDPMDMQNVTVRQNTNQIFSGENKDQKVQKWSWIKAWNEKSEIKLLCLYHYF